MCHCVVPSPDILACCAGFAKQAAGRVGGGAPPEVAAGMGSKAGKGARGGHSDLPQRTGEPEGTKFPDTGFPTAPEARTPMSLDSAFWVENAAMNSCTLDEARAAKARALDLFRRKATVVGVGITRIDDGYGVKVNLQTPPDPKAELPATIDGVPVRVEVVGKIRKR